MSWVDVSFAIVALMTLMLGVGYISRLLSTWHSRNAPAQPATDPEEIALLDRKTHLLEDLRDLEMDYQMGKIPEDAYQHDKQRLEPQAVAVLKELEVRGLGPGSDDSLFLDDED
jgi:hypothetical protein